MATNDPEEAEMPGERQPLLNTHSQTRADGTRFWEPAVLWILIPITILTAALAGALPSKQILILDLICRDVTQDEDEYDCANPEVSSRFAILNLCIALVSGLLLIVSVPSLCTLSDRRGRKLPLMVAIGGIIANEIITLFAAIFPATFPTYLLVLGAGLEGLTGYTFATTSLAGSYLRDCTGHENRSAAFGWLYGCFAVGTSVGPYLAGLIVETTGGALAVFIVALGIHVSVLLFVWLLMPESLPLEAKLQQHERSTAEQRRLWFSLKIFSESPRLRRNIILLAIVDTIIFGVGLGSAPIILYVILKFDWRAVELGHLMTVSHGTSMFANFILLPGLTWMFQSKTHSPCSTFDINLTRLALVVTALGYIGYAVSPSSSLVLISGAVVWLGGISAPVVQSSLTKHVTAEKTGALLGMVGQWHAVGRIIFPVVFDLIFAGTVGSVPWLVFVLLAGVLAVGVAVSLGVRTGEVGEGLEPEHEEEESQG